MNVKIIRFLTISLFGALAIFPLNSNFYAEEQRLDKIEVLLSLIQEGVYNEKIFKEASRLSESKPESLAFAIQAFKINPSASNYQLVNKIRSDLNPEYNFEEWTPLLYLKFFPTYIFDYIIIVISIFFLLYNFSSFKHIFLRTKLIMLFTFIILFVLRFVVYFDTFGDLNFNNPFSKINHKHAVILKKTSGYAGPSFKLQETLVLEPGKEVILTIYKDNDNWFQAKTKGGRLTWIKYVPEALYVIK